MCKKSKSLQENPSTTMKFSAMIIPTPSKIEIYINISFSEIVQIEDEVSEVAKRPKLESERKTEREMVEIKGKKMKEKVQGPTFQIHEYSFA